MHLVLRRLVGFCLISVYENEVKNAVVDKVLGRTGNTGNVTQVRKNERFDSSRSVSLSWMLASVAL